jgi:hypothetical protein
VKKLILAIALGISLAGPGLAQNNPPTPVPNSGDPGGADKQKSITDPKYMAGFYSDTAMTQLRTTEEVQDAFKRMSNEDKAAVKNACVGPDLTANMQALCAVINTM